MKNSCWFALQQVCPWVKMNRPWVRAWAPTLKWLMVGWPTALQTTAFCFFWNFCCQLFWVRKGLVISSSIPAMVVRRGEPDSREWETWLVAPVEATYKPEPWRGIVQVACLIRQIIKTSAVVRGEIAITRCIFLITLPSCCNDMHWKAPSSGITVKLLGHFTRVARVW